MKLCCAVAVAVLVLALCSQGESHSAGPQKCCFRYYSQALPARKIKDYKVTSPSCPKPGVILITVRNRMLCANPNVKQVRTIMDKIDNLFGL